MKNKHYNISNIALKSILVLYIYLQRLVLKLPKLTEFNCKILKAIRRKEYINQ